MWPVARSKVARKLQIDIPKDVNIFGDSDDNPYTIDQTVALVIKMVMEQEKPEPSEKFAEQ